MKVTRLMFIYIRRRVRDVVKRLDRIRVRRGSRVRDQAAVPDVGG